MEGMSENTKGLRRLLSRSLWRGAGEKAGFREDDGWTDGNCTLTQTTEARGHRVLSSCPHMGTGAPQAIPLHEEGDAAVGLNTGSPDEAHRAGNLSASVCPRKPSNGGGTQNMD